MISTATTKRLTSTNTSESIVLPATLVETHGQPLAGGPGGVQDTEDDDDDDDEEPFFAFEYRGKQKPVVIGPITKKGDKRPPEVDNSKDTKTQGDSQNGKDGKSGKT